MRFLKLELSKDDDDVARELREDKDAQKRNRGKSRRRGRGAKLDHHEKNAGDNTQSRAMLESAFMEWLEKDGGTFVRRKKVDASENFDVADNVSDEIDYDLFDAMAGSDDDFIPALRVNCDENDNTGFDFDFPREFAIAQKRRSSVEFQTWLQSISNLSADDNTASSDDVQ